MAEPTIDLVARAATYLAAQEADILFRWIQRVSRLLADAGQPETHLPALRDHMPDILAQLRHRLRTDRGATTTTAAADTGLPQAHAVTRHQQHVPAGVVVQEYGVLRREVWAKLRQWDADPPLSVVDVFLLEDRINAALDALIAVTLDTFMRLEASHVPPFPSADDPGRR
jgi:hypothetical protein